MLKLLLLVWFAYLARADVHCLSNSSLSNIVSYVNKYDGNITMANILTLDKVVSEAYENIPQIGRYKVEIESKYKIFAGASVENGHVHTASITTNLTYGYNSENNIWLEFSEGLVTISCSLAWTAKINCGTFAEIHFPFDQNPLIKQKIYDLASLINLSIYQLCAGPYHIWLTYSTRVGQVIKAVLPIFIGFPFCSC